METILKTCLNCEKTVRGRSDKKFCSDGCRNGYHNQLKAGDNNLVRNINHALARNRRLLQEYAGIARATRVSKEKLIMDGFQYRYITHIETGKKGTRYFFCYDYGYRQVNDDVLQVIRKLPGGPKKVAGNIPVSGPAEQ